MTPFQNWKRNFLLPRWKTGKKEKITTALHMKDSDSFHAKSKIGATKVAELEPGLTSSGCSSLNLMLKIMLRLKHHFVLVNLQTYSRKRRPLQQTGFNRSREREDFQHCRVQLKPTTVPRRVEAVSQDIWRQALKNLSHCSFSSLQFSSARYLHQNGFPGLYNRKGVLPLLEEGKWGEDIENKFKKIHPQ